MPSRVTLGAIARRAGVHLSTVSLALRNSPKLRPEMIARIRKVADELGYRPDPALAALVAHRKGVHVAAYQSTLAWLDNWPMHGMRLRDITVFNDYFLGARERAASFGYKLEEFFMREPGIHPARMASILRSRNIQGIVVPPQEYDGLNFDFDFSDFSAVTLGYSLRPARLHVVTNHQFRAIQLLVNKLHELGYRRIGLCICLDWDNKVNHGYSSGFYAAQAALGVKKTIPPFLPKGINPTNFRQWLEQCRPDAIITQGIAREMVGWLRSFGVSVPGDVGVANLSAHPSEPDIAGSNQNDRLIGATAVDVLASMLQRNERGLPDHIVYTLVDASWFPGDSVENRSEP